MIGRRAALVDLVHQFTEGIVVFVGAEFGGLDLGPGAVEAPLAELLHGDEHLVAQGVGGERKGQPRYFGCAGVGAEGCQHRIEVGVSRLEVDSAIRAYLQGLVAIAVVEEDLPYPILGVGAPDAAGLVVFELYLLQPV